MTDRPVLVYLNVISGITIIIVAQLKSNSYLQTVLLFLLAVISIIVGFLSGNPLKNSVQSFPIGERYQEKKANRMFRSILLILNLISFVVLLLFIPFLVMHLIIFILLNSIFLIIVCLDFGGLGLELARKRQSRKRNQVLLFT